MGGDGGIGECERGGVGYAFPFFQHSILLIFIFRFDNTKHHSPMKTIQNTTSHYGELS